MMKTELEGVLDLLFAGLEDLFGKLERDLDGARDLDLDLDGIGVRVRVRVGTIGVRVRVRVGTK